MREKNVNLDNKTILVTGAGGFIGYYLTRELLRRGCRVIGFDSMNDYYEVSLKEYRVAEIEKMNGSFTFIRGNMADKELVARTFMEYKPEIVVNLAAQAGVRYSIDHPDVYIESNLIGFYNILEACRYYPVEHLVYASSSSVYGGNKKVPFSTDDKVDNPVSLYAATKKSNELLAHAYSKLHNIPSTGLRFFTVYGPAGRPDMAYFGFTNKLRAGKTIEIFNYGNCMRDFTYVDDIVEGIVRVMQCAPESGEQKQETLLKNEERRMKNECGRQQSCRNILKNKFEVRSEEREEGMEAPYRIYNIGGSHPENLLDFVQILSEELVRAEVLPAGFDFDAHKKLVPMQPGDVPVTYADATALENDFGFKPEIDLRTGLRSFAEWYKGYYEC